VADRRLRSSALSTGSSSTISNLRHPCATKYLVSPRLVGVQVRQRGRYQRSMRLQVKGHIREHDYQRLQAQSALNEDRIRQQPVSGGSQTL
jgi:hypothetical protein